ncbi:ribonuclease domain-containing protein [Haliangium sp. UPWRP_2]|uniref:ribonuclease domain-containing protein n=1 Tax=Haliangium sp. UPWRP_2 TaxID=1931276 RepID=UPI000D0D3E0E|nr:ribonuclease domain-containing protein [Haliangium sp. UPWRP_2]PSM31796.1 ribonuclease [Haliangium sp. UPWRP_2]
MRIILNRFDSACFLSLVIFSGFLFFRARENGESRNDLNGNILFLGKNASQANKKSNNQTLPTGEAHNVVLYQKYKQALAVAEKANPLIESLMLTGRLPPDYVDKRKTLAAGWQSGEALNKHMPNKQFGGDIYTNKNLIVPAKPGRIWFEADVGLDGDLSRSSQPRTRLLYSNDGYLCVTADHYETVHCIGNYKTWTL